jgi:hypothetical protein
MSDMIAVQKKGDSKMLAPYLRSLVLPDAEHWFVAEFGDDHCEEQSPVQMIVWGRASHLGTRV